MPATMCTAPSCPKPAIWKAEGTDFDGADFTEYVCDGCGGYLRECGAKLEPLLTTKEDWGA